MADPFYEMLVDGTVIAECAWENEMPKLVRTSTLAEALGFALDFTEEVEIYDTRYGLTDIKEPKDPFQFGLWLAQWAQDKNREGTNIGAFDVRITNMDWDKYSARVKPGWKL